MALQIVDEKGSEALSMRTLAQRLEAGTATLYRHFANRDELVAHVVDYVLGEVQLSAEDLTAMGWRQACELYSRAVFAVLDRHHNIAPLLAQQSPVGPNAMAQREQLLTVLLANGFPAPLAARSYAIVARYVLGFAIRLPSDQFAESQLSGLLRTLNPELFPATHSVADHLPVPMDEQFTLGLELIIDGLAKMRRRHDARFSRVRNPSRSREVLHR